VCLVTHEPDFASRASSEATAMTSVNRSDQAVELYWLDFNGLRKFYLHLAPGARAKQNTFIDTTGSWRHPMAVRPQRAMTGRSSVLAISATQSKAQNAVAQQTAPETARFDLQQANRPWMQGSKIAGST
jgi:hypothetical protein